MNALVSILEPRNSNLKAGLRWGVHGNWLLGLWSFLSIVSLESGASAAGRTPWTTGRVVGSPNPPAPYAIERLHPQHTFDHPTDLSFLPGSTRLVVAEQAKFDKVRLAKNKYSGSLLAP